MADLPDTSPAIRAGVLRLEAMRSEGKKKALEISVIRLGAQIQSQPVDLSVVQDGKHEAESMLISLASLLEAATPERRPVVKAEIAYY